MNYLQYYELSENEIIRKRDLQFILNRLGYKKTKTIVRDEEIKKIRELIEEAKEISIPKGVFGVFQNFGWLQKEEIEIGASHLSIAGKGSDTNSCILEGNIRKLHDLTANAAQKVKEIMAKEYIHLLCVTLGSGIDKQIQQFMENGELYKAAVFDAAASVFVDSAVSNLFNKYSEKTMGQGVRLSNFRISPGQLGIPMDAQKIIYSLLELEKMDVGINNHFMLNPQKTVIAIVSYT